MNSSENFTETDLLSADLMKRFQYPASLLNHWLETFGLNQTLELLDGLRLPYNSMWVQVNTRRVDYDTLFDIFEEMGNITRKHPFFDDFIDIDVNK